MPTSTNIASTLLLGLVVYTAQNIPTSGPCILAEAFTFGTTVGSNSRGRRQQQRHLLQPKLPPYLQTCNLPHKGRGSASSSPQSPSSPTAVWFTSSHVEQGQPRHTRYGLRTTSNAYPSTAAAGTRAVTRQNSSVKNIAAITTSMSASTSDGGDEELVRPGCMVAYEPEAKMGGSGGPVLGLITAKVGKKKGMFTARPAAAAAAGSAANVAVSLRQVKFPTHHVSFLLYRTVFFFGLGHVHQVTTAGFLGGQLKYEYRHAPQGYKYLCAGNY